MSYKPFFPKGLKNVYPRTAGPLSRTANSKPFALHVSDGRPYFAVVGASPEVHVRLTGDQVEIRPIAAPHRGKTEAEDLAQSRICRTPKKKQSI